MSSHPFFESQVTPNSSDRVHISQKPPRAKETEPSSFSGRTSRRAPPTGMRIHIEFRSCKSKNPGSRCRLQPPTSPIHCDPHKHQHRPIGAKKVRTPNGTQRRRQSPHYTITATAKSAIRRKKKREQNKQPPTKGVKKSKWCGAIAQSVDAAFSKNRHILTSKINEAPPKTSRASMILR